MGWRQNEQTFDAVRVAHVGDRFHLSYTRPTLPGGLLLKGSLHYFMDDDFSDEYGWEANLVLVKTFNDNLKGLLKIARFDAASDRGYADIRQVSAEVNYSF